MGTIAHADSYTLSRHRAGSTKEMLFLFAPLFFSVFSGSLMSFCDRLFVSHYSVNALKAVTAANYFCLLFQLGISRITMMTQVCVGKSYGERKIERLGPYCWQMIWLSLLSMIVTLPLGIGLIPYLFGSKGIAAEGSAYFSILMYGNFLFPLAVALSAYFNGLGKTRLVGICSFGAQIANVGLNYLLIFGIVPGLPPLGAKGAALGTVISQALLCLALLVLFLKERQDYQTSRWSINGTLFKEMVCLGFPKSLSKILLLIAWNLAIRPIVRLEGDHLLVLSVGSSLWLIYVPVLQTVEQVLTTQVAFYRGEKAYSTIWKSVRSSMLFLFVCFLILGLLFLFCLDPFLTFFLHEPIAPRTFALVKLACLWLWILFFLEGLNLISLGLISGLGLTWFRLKLSVLFAYPFTYLPFNLAFCYWHLGPDKIWMLCWVCMLASTPVCFIKAKICIQKLAAAREKQEPSNLLT